MSKILIVEDETKIARFVELELTHEGYEVQTAFDGRSGLAMCESWQPDLLILDLMLPELSGIEVCRRLRQQSDVPIIMLTAKDDVSDKVMGLDMGADDYMTKPFAIEELLARIRMVLRNADPASQGAATEVLSLGDLTLSLASRQVTRADELIELTKTQYDLLEYLLRNRDIVLTRDQILSQVWGYSYAGNSNVVDVYVRYVRNRIHDTDESKIIETVRGIGYVIRDKTRKE